MRKMLLIGFFISMLVGIMPAGASCDLCLDPLDPLCHWSPDLVPYSSNVFYTPQDTMLTVNEKICHYPEIGWGMEPLSDVTHGKITFHKHDLASYLYDGSFTYTPDLGFTGWDEFEYGCLYDSEAYGYCHSDQTMTARIYVVENSIPEFPSGFLPATMIIGILGAVLLIQRTREH